MIEAIIEAVLSALMIPWVFYITLVLLALVGMCGLHADGTENESNPALFWSFMVSGIIFAFVVYHFQLSWKLIHSNLAGCCIGFVVYFVLGVLWSYFKWMRFVKKVRVTFDHELETWLQETKITLDELKTSIHPVELIDEHGRTGRDIRTKLYSFMNHMKSNLPHRPTFLQSSYTYGGVIKEIVPKVSKFKSLVGEWIALWPLSVVSALLRDALRELVSFLFDMIKRRFQSIADSAFKDV